MAVSDEQIACVTDLFSDIGPLSTRKMFGGLAIYANGTVFALLMSDGSLKLKGAGSMPAAYEADGWHAWTYTRKNGGHATMPYWTMPEALRDDPEAACAWARRALAEL